MEELHHIALLAVLGRVYDAQLGLIVLGLEGRVVGVVDHRILDVGVDRDHVLLEVFVLFLYDLVQDDGGVDD